MHKLTDCSLLGDLKAEAERGVRFRENFSEQGFVDPQERTYSADGATARIPLTPPPSIPGDLVGAGGFGRYRLAQWSFGGSLYVVLHDEDGNPVSSPQQIDFGGELFAVGNSRLIFIRWEDGLPVQALHANWILEWVRALP